MALAALALSMTLSKADAARETAGAPYTIERSLVTTVTAPDGHVYRLLVSWPDGAPPAEGWPVLYLLDGADQFATVTETARRLTRAGARSSIEPGVVVGIDSGGLPRRVLDYTPPSPGWTIPSGAPASGLATGGASAFLILVENRVKPLVAARWRVDPGRQTLAGHSFGGLLALHAMFVRPTIASRYAAVSPSLWFGGDLLSREERGGMVQGKSALIAVGSDERGPDAHAGSAAEALARRLTNAGAPTRFLSLSGQDHGTTMLAATGQIVTLAFGRKP